MGLAQDLLTAGHAGKTSKGWSPGGIRSSNRSISPIVETHFSCLHSQTFFIHYPDSMTKGKDRDIDELVKL